MIRVGSLVVFEARKQSARPGPRAKEISPASAGEFYSYAVDKYWIVAEVLDGKALCLTRGGKSHRVAVNELRKANWWEKLQQWGRYQNLKGKLADWKSGAVRPTTEQHPGQE